MNDNMELNIWDFLYGTQNFMAFSINNLHFTLLESTHVIFAPSKHAYFPAVENENF